ncbi:MAG: hypothetical protein BJ554DRAFT_4908 [Olpidium bornovanus]|uniref:Uncharacterized protein n=1 Tax=Olpidium bornovanus TaxID=278681 RepID=A0A8H7ZM57_9FUNG|nr:MAG: hypothetical protein BJ554DRAFT_4908 [Olpidium bornovanus]
MEVIEIIGQKKALDVNEYSVRLVMANGTEIEPERMSTKISEFDLVGVTMYKREENPSPAGLLDGICRRGGSGGYPGRASDFVRDC